jgi:chromosome segregation ATPase
MKKELLTSIRTDIRAIEQTLESIEDAAAFESAAIKNHTDSLSTLLPLLKDEVNKIACKEQEAQVQIKGLEKECEFFEQETRTLKQTLNKKNMEKQKMEEIIAELDDLETKKQLDAFDRIDKEILKLEQRIEKKNNQLKQLREKIESAEALQEGLGRCIGEVRKEKERTAQLQEQTRQAREELEELATTVARELKIQQDHVLLAALRMALYAKHENLEPPQWGRLIELLDLEDEA